MQTSSGRVSKPPGQSASACSSCRRRKSRCIFEMASSVCLMCRAHQTECVMTNPVSRRGRRSRRSPIPRPARSTAATSRARSRNSCEPTTSARPVVPEPIRPSPQGVAANNHIPATLDGANDDSPHVVGPAIAGDSRFLEDHLSSIQASDDARAIRPVLPGVSSAPVVFTRVKKRPLGLSIDPNPSLVKLQIVEKLLEPQQDAVINMYFTKSNRCFPVLDEALFKEHGSMDRISPAVLSCLYAHALIYWNFQPELSKQRRPDGRFIWNLALEALYSELHVSPGMASISAILLNIGGRPTTTMIGNGMLLGGAISLAQGLGLNRNPTPWDIPEQEKALRIQMWWCLVIHDRWTSFMYGTPPHVRQSHHDVPPPNANNYRADQSPPSEEGPGTFEALCSLTNVIGIYLEHIYSIGDGPAVPGVVGLNLATWTETLTGEIRKIIVRGTNLDIAGAANLRLCYLAARVLSCRLELNAEVEGIIPGSPPSICLLNARRMVEDIVLFVQELTAKQLGDFWMPYAAFVFSFITAFLVRLAVQIEIPAFGASHSLSLSLAKDLMASLRSHKDTHGWELGDACLSQYGHVVDKLWTQQTTADVDMSLLDLAPLVADPVFLDSIMDDQWNAFI